MLFTDITEHIFRNRLQLRLNQFPDLFLSSKSSTEQLIGASGQILVISNVSNHTFITFPYCVSETRLSLCTIPTCLYKTDNLLHVLEGITLFKGYLKK